MSNILTMKYGVELQNLASFFDCGNSIINSFLKSDSSLDPNYGTTYLWLSESKDAIIGYYNISVGTVIREENNIAIKEGGSVHINYFALSSRYRGWHINNSILMSDILLADCLNRIERIREKIGFAFVTLASTKEGHDLYSRHGFEDYEADMTFIAGVKEHNSIPMYKTIDVY